MRDTTALLVMAVYENYWTRKEQAARLEKRRIMAGREPAPPIRCKYLTKKGDPCKGKPNDEGACVGHQNALDAGKELVSQ